MAANDQPIVIKRIVKGDHAHHGGAWKVAYADFVTAMMAFFLLMWLINNTSPDQKKGIADYFAPQSVAQTVGGSGGRVGRKKSWASRILGPAAPPPACKKTAQVHPPTHRRRRKTAMSAAALPNLKECN